MGVERTTQYRVVPSACTAANAALSTFAVRRLAQGVNNFAAYKANGPTVFQAGAPWAQSILGSESESVIVPFGYRIIPDQFNYLQWSICHRRVAGAGNTAWKLYAMEHPYYGPFALATSRQGVTTNSGTITTSSDDYAFPSGITSSITVARGLGRKTWLLLTANNTDDTTQSEIRSIVVWPSIESAPDE